MEVPDSYRGREQTFVKHRLLETYLKRLFMIIGQSQRIIRYVDCFSGPWQEHDENLSDTSIGISLNTMHNCRAELRKLGKQVEFKALFIEKDDKAYDKLTNHLETMVSPHVTCHTLHGGFYKLREQILKWCGPDDFTFFFIDPTGWKKVVEIPTLEPLLSRHNSELLINFMYDFLLRTHTMESFQEDMKAIFGFVPDTSGMQPKDKEKALLGLYLSRLREIAPRRGGPPRAVYVPILYPLRDRTLYHLIYLTRHPRGIVAFMEASEDLEFVQTQARAQAKQEKRVNRTGQLELLPPCEDIIDESVTLDEVKEYWLKRLSFTPEKFDIRKLADMLEETRWFIRDFQKAYGELVMEGLVKNLDDTTQRRTKNFVHFSKNERLVRLEP